MNLSPLEHDLQLIQGLFLNIFYPRDTNQLVAQHMCCVDPGVLLWNVPNRGKVHNFHLAYLRIEYDFAAHIFGLDLCRESREARTDLLTRQSKLSQEELNQLQKDTHFDKKELQQWYKGQQGSLPPA